MSVSLRVAIDLRPLALESTGGVGLLVSQLLEEVPRRGVSYVGVSDRPVPPGRVPASIPVHVGGAPGQRIRWERGVLPRLLASLDPRPDLFHATWNHGVPAGLSMPSVLSLHDLIPWRLPREVPWPKPAWLHRALYRSAVRDSARRAAVILTLSEASRRDIAARIPDAAPRVAVVPCALPRWFTAPAAARLAENRRAFGDPYWLYVGGFDPRKGLFTLLAAMAAAFPDGRSPALVMAGGRNEHEQACEAMAAALRVNAIFPGYVPDADLPALFGGAALFVYPSRYEGFGIPPLLALAAGVPCVTTDGGALPEVVGDDAIVVKAGDAKALAEALRGAAADPAPLRALAARGRGRAAGFSLEALAERTIQAYERALGRPGGRA
ncbi:MAG TPA: glycosyltransferase family 1 protein [Candidatus Eisenbacteria bacterium]|nr:glycosyltransferase family 1 protein [Candidatus Eisenbacteria bacterium]